MYSSGGCPPCSTLEPQLVMQSDPLRFQRLGEREPRGDKSVGANPPFHLGMYVRNY